MHRAVRSTARSLECLSVADVSQLLGRHSLHVFVDAMSEHEINGEMLADLTRNDVDELQVGTDAQRRRLMEVVGRAKAEGVPLVVSGRGGGRLRPDPSQLPAAAPESVRPA